MSAESTFNALPGVAKVVIVVAGTGLTLVTGYMIYSAVKKRIGLAGSFKEKREVDDEIKNLANKNVKPTYSDSQYLAWANQIHAGFDGYGSGVTQLPSIFIKLKNDADMLKLINAYGIREISSGKLNPTPNFKGTLAGAIADELDAFEINQMNRVLSANKITITF